VANQKAVEDALARAVESATVDLDADPAERVAFDPPALGRVSGLYRAPGGRIWWFGHGTGPCAVF
jgi:hypothetical protein